MGATKTPTVTLEHAPNVTGKLLQDVAAGTWVDVAGTIALIVCRRPGADYAIGAVVFTPTGARMDEFTGTTRATPISPPADITLRWTPPPDE